MKIPHWIPAFHLFEVIVGAIKTKISSHKIAWAVKMRLIPLPTTISTIFPTYNKIVCPRITSYVTIIMYFVTTLVCIYATLGDKKINGDKMRMKNNDSLFLSYPVHVIHSHYTYLCNYWHCEGNFYCWFSFFCSCWLAKVDCKFFGSIL